MGCFVVLIYTVCFVWWSSPLSTPSRPSKRSAAAASRSSWRRRRQDALRVAILAGSALEAAAKVRVSSFSLVSPPRTPLGPGSSWWERMGFGRVPAAQLASSPSRCARRRQRGRGGRVTRREECDCGMVQGRGQAKVTVITHVKVKQSFTE